MRKIDNEGLRLCDLQGQIFERSVGRYSTSSPVFIRRFMNSSLCAEMDRPGFLNRPMETGEAYQRLDEEYGASQYGQVCYSGEELFWIGYLYRYWAYTRETSSRKIYHIITSREMRELYLAYHTLDPANAIDRILEAKGIVDSAPDEIAEGVRILRKIHDARHKQ